MRTSILFIVITGGKKERKIQPPLSTLSIWETNTCLRKQPPPSIYITLPITINRHGHNSVPSPSLQPPPPPSHLPLHCDCHCYWYATQPSHLVSQATATPMRAYAGRNPNHPRLRHTDPFDPTERRVSGLSLCP